MSTVHHISPLADAPAVSLFDLDQLGRTIDVSGVDAADPGRLEAVVAYARQHGLRRIATDVLADVTAPRPVRERAFGIVAVAVGAHLSALDFAIAA